ncbi:MAG: tripartite tricarboxylate transporter substrate binding protein [Betaproteobacteria bacterium]|nr:tripartite tricarboxylate transporter substrate binding protein [Betaproteobacteria bacterium]
MNRIALLIASLLLSAVATAQPYPNKPIRVIVPFGPGSSTDVITRILTQSVSTSIGQPFIIDNKPGGDGAVAGIEAAKAAPDGYTIFIGSGSPIAAVPALRKNPPYDSVNDFTPITDIGRFTLFLFVNSEVPVKTFQEFIAYAKANPGKLAYGTGNASGIVAFAQMNQLAGIDMLHVPYKSAPLAVVDLMTNRVQAMWEPPTTTLAAMKEGKLRALVTSLKSRSSVLPEVPTIAEAGMPQFSMANWMGLVGPAKLPREIVDRLNREFVAAMKRPEVIAAMEKQLFQLNPTTPEQFAVFVKEQIESYGSLLRAAGVKPD